MRPILIAVNSAIAATQESQFTFSSARHARTHAVRVAEQRKFTRDGWASIYVDAKQCENQECWYSGIQGVGILGSLQFAEYNSDCAELCLVVAFICELQHLLQLSSFYIAIFQLISFLLCKASQF